MAHASQRSGNRMNHQRFLRKIVLMAQAVCLTLLFCACTGLPGSEDLPAPTPAVTSTPAPSPTETPLSPSPTPIATVTPTPTPSRPSPTPTPVIADLKNGWYNAMATWTSNGKLVQTASSEHGSMIYANNFERDDGNRVAPSNTCNNAEIYTTDRIAYSGYYSVKVSRRRQEYHGLSGFGLRLNIENGLTFNDLIDKVLCIRCMIYFEDEGFGVPDTLYFTAYDAYHTEKVLDYVYNRKDGLRTLDKDGNPVMKEQERFVKCNSVRALRGCWNECVFYVKVTDSDVASGSILIGTSEELPNSVGLYCSYYIDDLTVSVLSPYEYPYVESLRTDPVNKDASPRDDTTHVLDDIAQGPPVEPEEDQEKPEE